MERRDDDPEGDPRVYARVFDRLADGASPEPPRRLEQTVTATRARLGDAAEVLVRHVRSSVGGPSGWQLTWQRLAPRGPRPLHREPSMLVALASFAFAFSVAWWTGGPTEAPPRRVPAALPAAAVPAAVAPVPAPVEAEPWDVAQILHSGGASDDAKLAIIEELARDPSDSATQALLSGVGVDSVYVSMAALRALSGRRCDMVASTLSRRLDDPLWQRRAWAARVLGTNDCAGTAPRVARRLAVEPDARVQLQLRLALDAFKESGA
jgi:hypothetical protein